MRSRMRSALQRLGLMHRTRTLTDLHRRQICTMIDGGMSDVAIGDCFGYSAVEIAEARGANPITGSIRTGHVTG